MRRTVNPPRDVSVVRVGALPGVGVDDTSRIGGFGLLIRSVIR
jgi:hypothetical protein